MDAIALVVSFLVFLSVWVVYLLVRSYVPKYLEEKAKNLASKEDLAAITEIVERVRTDHAQELEEFRSQIQLLRDDLLTVRSEGRKYAARFFEASAQLALDQLTVPPEDIGYHTGMSVSDYRRRLNARLTSVIVEHAWLLTYFHEDDNVLEAADTVVAAAKQVRAQIMASIDKIALAEHRQAHVDPNDRTALETVVKEQLLATAAYKKATSEHIDRFVDSFSGYSEVLSNFLKRRVSS